jgi:hypothetical protein
MDKVKALFGLGEKKEFPVKKSEDEWRKTLGAAEYRVLRKVGASALARWRESWTRESRAGWVCGTSLPRRSSTDVLVH